MGRIAVSGTDKTLSLLKGHCIAIGGLNYPEGEAGRPSPNFT